MRLYEKLPGPREALGMSVGCRFESQYAGIRGDVFMDLVSSEGEVLEHREQHNLIVKDASILVARLMKGPPVAGPADAPFFGVFALAVGSGNWTDLQSPPAATNTQRSLYAELARKRFSTTRFIDASGAPSEKPTNVVDFSVTFAESEAVGALTEMALIGGNVSTNMSQRNPVMPPNGAYDASVDLRLYDTQINYTTFKVLNKPATSSLSLTWRLTF